jgi:hypothetical protein
LWVTLQSSVANIFPRNDYEATDND